MDVFRPSKSGSADGPLIAEFTRTAAPGDSVTAAGPGFGEGVTFRFFGQTQAAAAVSLERDAVVADSVAATVVVPEALPRWSTYLMWPEVGGVRGSAVAINRTEAWWVGPDEGIAGERAAVYGRNLAHDNENERAWIFLETKGGGLGRWVAVDAVNPYRVEFRIPKIEPGEYGVWAHNGHGGDWGWSGPLRLTILAHSPWAGARERVVDVRDHGAVGDGKTDETAAIQSALDAATKVAPATVYFPAGIYEVNGMIDLRDGVSWRGAGRDETLIRPGADFASGVEPWWPALIFSDAEAVTRVEFADLSLEGAGRLGGKSLLIFRHHKHVRITDACLSWQGAGGGVNLGSNDFLAIRGSEFIGDQVFLGNSRQVIVLDNEFRLTDYAHAALMSWGGSEVAIIGNGARDLDASASSILGVGAGRFLVTQCHPDSNRHFYIADNRTTDLAPPVGIGDPNQGEQILFETGTSTFAARPLAATPTTVTFAEDVPVARSQDAVIVAGSGAGQFRRVADADGRAITVTPPWSVVPDETSVVGIGPAQTRSVVYRNRFDGKADFADYATASVALSMYGNTSDVIFAGNEVTDIRNGLVDEYSQVPRPETPTPSACFFNVITDNSLDRSRFGMRIMTDYLTEESAGTLGHLGNHYRRNEFRNLRSAGIYFGGDENGHPGGDVTQNVFEENGWTGLPVGIRNEGAATLFERVVFRANRFDAGNVDSKGSQRIEGADASVSWWWSGNEWTGFEPGERGP